MKGPVPVGAYSAFALGALVLSIGLPAKDQDPKKVDGSTSTTTVKPEAPKPSPETDIRAGDGSTLVVDSSIAAEVQNLFDKAAADGIVLGGHGLRSHDRQHELRRINGCPNDGSWTHQAGEDPSSWRPASNCRVPTARPGFSNHESGLAIDFTYQGESIRTRNSTAYHWLNQNAAAYGLKNLPSEPWHWSTNGR